MPKNLIADLASAAPNRRRFLKTIGAATAGVTALSMAGVLPAKAATMTEVEVLQFALNLEYLEAEFYTFATYGTGIESQGIGTHGLANGPNPPYGGTTSGGRKVTFKSDFIEQLAYQIGSDEREHVTLLREALGADKIAKPDIHVNALDLDIATERDFLVLGRIFEDIGVTAYAGAASLLSTPQVINYAARILAVESQHVAAIRSQIAILGIPTPKLDGADILPPPSGPWTTVLSINPANGLVNTRTPGEVLYLAFGKQNVTHGGFFPTGVNGAITMSGGPATSTNLA